MRFNQYITEKTVADFDFILESIKKDCKPAITFYKKAKSPLWRGLKDDSNNFVRKAVRSDRHPRVISDDLHKVLDGCFKKHWGWKARSEGVFSGSEGEVIANWGMPYVIFPIGKFEYVYTIDPMEGFWQILGEYARLDLSLKRNPEMVIEEICEFVKNDYKNKGLESVLKSNKPFEAILKCKEYYGVAAPNRQTFDYIMEKI